jgi:hypothetical protein
MIVSKWLFIPRWRGWPQAGGGASGEHVGSPLHKINPDKFNPNIHCRIVGANLCVCPEPLVPEAGKHVGSPLQ